MDDYISRGEARKAFLKALSKNSDREKSAIDWHNCKVILGSIPAADVVEVVRCKDCKNFIENPNDCISGYGLTGPEPMDFCPYGERRIP